MSDQSYLQQALDLARHGIYTTHPNPAVGCVIVKQGKVIGEGWHQQAGKPHAEINALKQAGQQAKNATAYITLEPCCHHGKTPPCTDALIAAKINKVIIAMTDPNPKVSGQGIKELQQAGITVETIPIDGVQSINRGYTTRMTKGRPFIQLKLAMSLDGKTALANGQSQWITGDAARRDVHQLRAQSHAIMIGSGTLTKDQPKLTVRLTKNEKQGMKPAYPNIEVRQPLRVILDTKCQIEPQATLLHQPGQTLIITQQKQKLPKELQALKNVNIAQVPLKNGHLDLRETMKLLAKEEINQLLVEAGPKLAGALIEENLVDECIIYMAPSFLGHEAQNLIQLPTIQALTQRKKLKITSIEPIGQDWRIVSQIGHSRQRDRHNDSATTTSKTVETSPEDCLRTH